MVETNYRTGTSEVPAGCGRLNGMADVCRKAQRIYLDEDLATGVQIACSKDRAHYLGDVLRLRVGDDVLVFNGRDGEWLARISEQKNKSCVVEVIENSRAQTPRTDLVYLRRVRSTTSRATTGAICLWDGRCGRDADRGERILAPICLSSRFRRQLRRGQDCYWFDGAWRSMIGLMFC